MHCSVISLKEIGIVEICSYGDRIREVKIRVGINGAHEGANDDLTKLIINYIRGLVNAREILKYISLSPGLLGLAQLAMLSIPRGRVATYSQIARLLNTSPRAVGRLASANKLPIIVPCHRVIKSDGSLGGYSIGNVRIKHALLTMEGVPIVKGRVSKQYFVSDSVLITNFKELLKLASQGMVI